jgi:replicative DNA helicase
VACWLDGLGVFGLRSYEKRVPDEVFRQPLEGIAVFLRHLWATDGCMWIRSGRYPVVRYDTTSGELADGLVSLLLRFGITASRRRVPMGARCRPSHRLELRGQPDLYRFLVTIGAVGRRRRATTQQMLAYLHDRDARTNRDSVPRAAWHSLVRPALEHRGITTRELQRRLGTQYCGSTLYRANLGRSRALAVAEVVDSRELRSLATSDVYWDEVVAVVPDGDEEVFDLTVEGLHNFVAEDLVVHNSIEQDADLVFFVYRDEYYNPEDSEAQGLAEVILAKHRNGPTDAVKLSFLKRYAKFADLAG